jgi:hypothetical protein
MFFLQGIRIKEIATFLTGLILLFNRIIFSGMKLFHPCIAISFFFESNNIGFSKIMTEQLDN